MVSHGGNNRGPELARRLYERFEPVHAVIYFAAEPAAALRELGYRGFWMGYFAARSAPLGQVPAEVVSALFYNFAPDRVAKSIPAAWDIAGPRAAISAREVSAAAALRRCGITDDGAAAVVGLAAKATRHASVDGRAIFAANRSLPFPKDPVASLWHVTTLLREHRGDGHVAALCAAGISGREANVLHAASGRVSVEFISRSRDYDAAAWQVEVRTLRRKGLLDDDGVISALGRDLKGQIEAITDELALRALDGLDDDEVEALFQALTPLTRKVMASGDIPAVTPMGLVGDDLDDASARLG